MAAEVSHVIFLGNLLFLWLWVAFALPGCCHNKSEQKKFNKVQDPLAASKSSAGPASAALPPSQAPAISPAAPTPDPKEKEQEALPKEKEVPANNTDDKEKPPGFYEDTGGYENCDELPQKRIFQVVPDNNVSILWQIPQIAVITAAEILFSITGFEFAYSQSPASMKSLVQALWILTVAAGDLIIVAVTLINFSNPVLQYLVYAGAMLVIITIFGVLSYYYYEYKICSDEESDCAETDQEDSLSDSTSYTQSKLSVVLTSNYGTIKTASNKPAKGLDNVAFMSDDVPNTNF